MVSRFPRQLPKTRLSSRTTHDTHAFKTEEKLDKWLDLQPCVAFRKECGYIQSWDELDPRQLGTIVSSDCLSELRQHGLEPSDITQCCITPRLITLVQKTIVNGAAKECHLRHSSIRSILTLIKNSSVKSMTLQHEHLTSNLPDVLRDFAQAGVDNLIEKMVTWPRELLSAFHVTEDMMTILAARRELLEFVNKSSSNARAHRRFHHPRHDECTNPFSVEIPSLGGTIQLTRDYSIMRLSGYQFLLNDELLLELVNKTSEMMCSLLYNHLQSGLILPPSHFDDTVVFYKAIINELLRIPIPQLTDNLHSENLPFSLLKGMEALGVAHIIMIEDALAGWENARLLRAMWRELYASGTVVQPEFEKHPLGQAFTRMLSPQIAELIGTIKVFGHPSVEIQVGVEQLYDRTHADLAINPEAVQGGIGVLTRDLCRNFYRKFKKLPLIDLERADLDPTLHRLFSHNVPILSDANTAAWDHVTALQWSTVRFLKNEEFDPIDNQLPLIKDKAVGLTRSQIMLMLIQDTGSGGAEGEWSLDEDMRTTDWQEARELMIRRRKKILKSDYGDWVQKKELLDEIKQQRMLGAKERLRVRAEMRRTLLSFLLEPHFDQKFKDYMKHFEEDNEWRNSVLDYLVIKLTPKELELKQMGRFFGASPPVERNRRVVVEHNVMRLMDKFVPDQLMTPDDLGIMKKLISFRYFGEIYPHHVLFQVSFDFSKWNNNMRAASIDVPASIVLDKWFGTHLYGKTMQAYQHMLVYLREKHATRYWMGQEGGIEGLNQATWSLIFLAGVKHALEQAGVKYQVTVKGDDVRAVIAVPSAQVEAGGGYDAMRDVIMGRITELCRDMGWQLNPQESFVSLTLIATSKQYQVRRCWLPAASKKIMKMMSLSNLLYPTLEDLIGSIFSSAHSACSQATAVYPAFASATIVAAMELVRSFSSKSPTVDQISAMLMWPQVLGGPGALPLQTFFVRGENDMLSVSLALMVSVIRANQDYTMSNLFRNIMSQSLDPDPDPKLILSDPYAIALNVPERPSAALKRLIREKLKGWVKNKDIAFILSDKGTTEKREFVNHLWSMRPMIIKLGAYLYENSPYYLEEEVMAKFMESRTVVALFSSGEMGKITPHEAHKALKVVISAAGKRKTHWWDILTRCRHHDISALGIPYTEWLNPNVCVTGLTRRVRDNAWGLEIIGITYPSLVTQCLLYPAGDLGALFPNWGMDRLCIQIGINIPAFKPQVAGGSHHYCARDHSSLWVGAQTALKAHIPSLESRLRSPSLDKVMKLVVLFRIVATMGREIQDTIHRLLRAFTSLNLDATLSLAPQGDSGHTAHRLPVHSFSMNTMPNFRHNILQLVRVNVDTMHTFRQDTRDRTINFAALHFFLSALAVLPLQVSERLPANYPQEFEALFHPQQLNTDTYDVCTDCNQVVNDNVQLRFSKPLPMSMNKFQTVKLVGCSSYDNKVLQGCEAEFLEKRVDSYILGRELNPADPRARHEAAYNVLGQMYNASLQLHQAAISEKYHRVPQGAALQACAVNLNLTSMYSVSIAVLRAIDADILYMGTLTLVFNWLIKEFTGNIDATTSSILEVIAPWNDALKGFFEKLTQACLLDTLTIGSSNVGLIRIPLNWKAGVETNAHSAAMTFVHSHRVLFSEWAAGGIALPRMAFFVGFEGTENIRNEITLKLEENRRWVFRNLNQHPTRSSVLVLFRNVLVEQVMLRLQWVNAEDIAEFDKVEILDMVAQEHPAAIEESVIAIILDGVQTPRLNGDRSHLSTTNFVLLMFMMRISAIVGPGPWFYIEGQLNLEPGVAHQVSEITIDRPEDDAPLHDTWNSVEIKYLRDYVGDQTSAIICDHLQIIHEFRQNWCQEVILQSDAWLDRITRMLAPICHFTIITQTIEDSERLLRNALGDRQQEVFDDHMRRVSRPLPIHHVMRLIIPEERFYRACHIRNDQAHQLMRHHPLLLPTSEINNLLFVNQTLAAIPNKEEYLQSNNVTIDLVELTRCFGRHNTSISKYLEMFSTLGLPHTNLISDNEYSLSICMADGIGGITAYLANLSPLSHVVYNSLKLHPRTEQPLADAAELMPPLETLDYFFHPNVKTRVTYTSTSSGNLASKQVQNTLVASVMARGGSPAVITMDADIDWSVEMAEYGQVLFGAYQVALRTVRQDTLCIFKTFLIRDPWIVRFIQSVMHTFRHVHLYRSMCTRQHSSEIFVIFQVPKQLDQLPHVATLLNDPRTHYPTHLAVEGYILNFFTTVNADIQEYKLRQRSTRNLALERFFNRLRPLHPYVLSLDAIMHWFGLSWQQTNFHMCEMFTVAQENCRESVRQHKHMLDSSLGVRGLPYIRTPRGKLMTGGWQFLRLEYKLVFKLIALEQTLYLIPSISDIPILFGCHHLITIVEGRLREHFEHSLARGQGRLIWRQGSLWRVDNLYEDNLTHLMRTTLNKVLQLVGVLGYLANIRHHAMDQGTFRHVLRSFTPSCQFRECCDLALLNSNITRHAEGDLPHGFSLLEGGQPIAMNQQWQLGVERPLAGNVEVDRELQHEIVLNNAEDPYLG